MASGQTRKNSATETNTVETKKTKIQTRRWKVLLKMMTVQFATQVWKLMTKVLNARFANSGFILIVLILNTMNMKC